MYSLFLFHQSTWNHRRKPTTDGPTSKYLLSIYAEDKIQQELETVTSNEMVYTKISSKLANLNIVHTGKQCQEKLKKLKQDYKKMNGHINRSGSDWRTSKRFDHLDALLGHRSAFSGTVGMKDSATTLLEAMVEDTETDNQSVDGKSHTANMMLVKCYNVN